MTEALLLELAVMIVTVGLYIGMKNMGYRNVSKKFIAMFIAILLFELMSEPMWRNFNLDTWAYLYRDVSWIITFGWLNIFFVSLIIVDKVWTHVQEKGKFWLYILVVTIITTPLEALLLKIGIRGYSPILTETFSGIMIPLTQVPIEVFLSVPIIAALVISFYKYFGEM